MSELQLELETVIEHRKHYPAYPITKESKEKAEAMLDAFMPGILHKHEATHKPIGVRLAKMLNQYDDRPSSELWREIQSLSREILK